jgi:uncharacterized protein YjbI with pentapeptide repeats
VDFTHVDLAGAELTGAELTEVIFCFSNLSEARLDYATLLSALFNEVVLRGANLGNAELGYACFNGADLADCDFSGALLSRTVFARCRGLATAKGLELTSHRDASSLDASSRADAGAALPEGFLAGIGAAR